MAEQSYKEISQRVLALRAIFLMNPAYRQFEDRFRYLLERRHTEIEAGVVAEARCIALIGASGSGKTTAVRHLLARHPDLILGVTEADRLDVVSLSVPTPATLKFVGQTTLAALGFPLRRERTAQTIWDMVKSHLQGRQTLFLHYDDGSFGARASRRAREPSSGERSSKALRPHC